MDDRELGATAVSRREFVVGMAALGAVWMVAGTACARDAGSRSAEPALVHFAPEQAAQVEAITARIIPTDASPGAREAGVVYFIDKMLTTHAREQAPLFAEGLASLDAAVKKAHGATATFAALTTAQQDALLTSIEKTPFFGAIRFATIAGFLSLPRYGGNKDYVGWKFIGQDNVMEHTAPFGWYDRPENQKALLGTVL